MSRYPEDIVNNMSLTELQNCDWDALFSQIQTEANTMFVQPGYGVLQSNNNNIYETGNFTHNGYKPNSIEKPQDIVISRKPIFIPLGKDDMETCRAIDIHNALILDSEFDFSGVSRISAKVRGIYDCKVCDEKFQTRASLITHVKVHQQPFCVPCLSPFKNLSTYKLHNTKYHSSSWSKQKSTNNNTNVRRSNRKKSKNSDSSADSSDVEEEEEEEERTEKRSNFYDMYNNLTTITLTSKYGRRRKVLDMTTVINKKTRKTK